MMTFERRLIIEEEGEEEQSDVAQQAHYYTVCNGLTNQMLGHAGNIALAVARGVPVMIPDAFITDGTQSVYTSTGLADVTPTPNNSIPLESAFDVRTLLRRIETFGINATVVPYRHSSRLKCSWLAALTASDGHVAKEILKAMVPSATVQRALGIIKTAVLTNVSAQRRLASFNEDPGAAQSSVQYTMGSAVCLHHRDGEDWHKHCDKWELQFPKNRNCRNHEPIEELVQRRISHLPSPWILYAGDHRVPKELRALKVPVINRKEMQFNDTELLAHFAEHAFKSMPRDIEALLDYHLCSQMQIFIGNSVSTWSASQIILRDTVASWYNSFGIPLDHFLRSYTIPFVYTYTEEGSHLGKLLLKVSVLSVRQHMPAASIHMLYHGKGDADFRGWLVQHGVVLHEHEPDWREKLEDARLAVVARPNNGSRLLSGSGNYFGTFQRIDIPRFLSVEYCILLEPDAFVVRPFTIADLGQLPAAGALSADLDERDRRHRDAGVALLNVPFLRKTLTEFRGFALGGAGEGFASAPGGRGAFLDFYAKSVDYLSTEFNMKPYYSDAKSWNNSYIIHYRGLKPHEQIGHWFGWTFEPSKRDLIERTRRSPYQCHALVMFANAAALEGDDLVKEYCKTALPGGGRLCADLLHEMARSPGTDRPCRTYLEAVILKNRMRPSDFPNIG